MTQVESDDVGPPETLANQAAGCTGGGAEVEDRLAVNHERLESGQ